MHLVASFPPFRVAQGNELGRALKVNMADWFTTSADNYLSRINRQAIEQAVTEAKGDQMTLAVKAARKKNEVVTIGERFLEGTNWIPVPLRIAPVVVTIADEGESQVCHEYQISEAVE